MMVISPVSAFSTIISLSFIFIVASSTPTIAGIPNSLETIAPCDNIPPRSTISPVIKGKTTTQPGSVCRVTNMSPNSNFEASITEVKTLARPFMMPPQTDKPTMVFFEFWFSFF